MADMFYEMGVHSSGLQCNWKVQTVKFKLFQRGAVTRQGRWLDRKASIRYLKSYFTYMLPVYGAHYCHLAEHSRHLATAKLAIPIVFHLPVFTQTQNDLNDISKYTRLCSDNDSIGVAVRQHGVRVTAFNIFACASRFTSIRLYPEPLSRS